MAGPDPDPVMPVVVSPPLMAPKRHSPATQALGLRLTC